MGPETWLDVGPETDMGDVGPGTRLDVGPETRVDVGPETPLDMGFETLPIFQLKSGRCSFPDSARSPTIPADPTCLDLCLEPLVDHWT